MEITKLEKAALITTGAGAAFMTLLWNLMVSVDSTNGWIIGLRIAFACVSFAAFDLVLLAVIARGWSISGAIALVITSALSGAIGLQVSGEVNWPALHAAPALALAAFGIHLMISRAPAPPAEVASTVNNTQINVGVPLPRTFAEFAAARAAELPGATDAEIAAALESTPATVRKLLDRVTTQPQQEG